ncbi:anti-sigma factor antagonist [Streptomyces pratensis]|uniref:anti-sigma factor antagonist n=1 Tax=Streptomyces pratensis TaxID=1169025 RepID=UPI0037B87D0B
MPLLSYRLDASRLVVELREAVDLENEALAERELRRLLPCCGPGAFIVDVRTPLLTASALRVLLRMRRRAGLRGVSLLVVARCATARAVLDGSGLKNALGVTYTIEEAEFRSRECLPTARERRIPAQRRWRARGLSAAERPPRPVGPYADTSLPRLPRRSERMG